MAAQNDAAQMVVILIGARHELSPAAAAEST
jgi:hypothetical protein